MTTAPCHTHVQRRPQCAVLVDTPVHVWALFITLLPSYTCADPRPPCLPPPPSPLRCGATCTSYCPSAPSAMPSGSGYASSPPSSTAPPSTGKADKLSAGASSRLSTPSWLAQSIIFIGSAHRRVQAPGGFELPTQPLNLPCSSPSPRLSPYPCSPLLQVHTLAPGRTAHSGAELPGRTAGSGRRRRLAAARAVCQLPHERPQPVGQVRGAGDGLGGKRVYMLRS